MADVDSLSESEMKKLASEMLASRARARGRSAKAATEKRQAGMMRLMLWVPAKWAPLIRPSVDEMITEFEQAEAEGRAQAASIQHHDHSHGEHYHRHHEHHGG